MVYRSFSWYRKINFIADLKRRIINENVSTFSNFFSKFYQKPLAQIYKSKFWTIFETNVYKKYTHFGTTKLSFLSCSMHTEHYIRNKQTWIKMKSLIYLIEKVTWLNQGFNLITRVIGFCAVATIVIII